MKKIVFFLFIFMSYFSYGQKTQPQSFNYTAPQIFSDSVKMNALGGSGTVIKIDENGYLYKSAGASLDTINISQVLGLQDSLNTRQKIMYGGDSITVRNDSIFWNGVAVNGVSGLIDSLNAKQNIITAGNYISISNDTINVTTIPVTFISGALDSINTRQRILIAGTGITISNDTISSTATGSDADWTVNGNYVYNLSDSIGIGVSDPDRALEISGQTKMSSSGTSTLEINNSVTGVGVDINSSIGSGISILSNKTFGYGIDLNSYQVDSISNDNTLVGADERALVTEQAVKGYVDNAIENNTRVSWGADVDTSARVNGFVLKWNGATKKHYYDTAGTGGGGSTYFAGAGLELSGTTFSIGNDSVSTAMVQDDAITYSKLQNVGGNSVLARAAASSGDISEVSLSANQLLGRGSTGNVDAIGLSGLSMVGKTLTNTNTGTVTNIAAGNGMTFSSITTTGTVTLGTPSTLTGTSANSVTTSSHTHAIDMTTLDGNIRTFYLDTARVEGDIKTAGKIAITNQEKVISFTLTREADSVRLRAGYYTLQGMVDIEVTNDDTTAGVAGFFQNYQLNAFVTDGVQLLGRPLSGTTTVIETAEANATPVSSTDGDGSPKDGTIKLHLTTVPVKFYLELGQFVALTIKATYPSPADFVSHKRATMILTKAIDFDGAIEQTPDIEAP